MRVGKCGNEEEMLVLLIYRGFVAEKLCDIYEVLCSE